MSINWQPTDWQPTASLENMKTRARILQGIRAFFAQQKVLEVETPVLSAAAITDPQLESLSAGFQQSDYYLQTSPEFYMKRLLAAGSGDIYQLARVFRDDELGRYHNPEFTLLEWYRQGYDHHQLMSEIEKLLKALLQTDELTIVKISYRQAFIDQLQIDPIEADTGALKKCAEKNKIEIPQGMDVENKDMWLDWFMLERIAPSFAKDSFTFLYDYPASQAALARLNESDPRLAHRFELFFGELELGNGFYELTDANEQQTRFENENKIRQQRGQKMMPIDEKLLGALRSGLPECSGFALGLDRLLMLLTSANHIREVISFSDELG